MGILLLFLQNFYKNEFNRKEMYLRYIYKLHDLHLAAENYTEAGFTMKLYADQLGWGSTILPPDHAHPQQPEWQRKELLYHKIIHYLDRGKCWEKGIPLCKELAVLYETRLYDYAKLSHVLKLQAKFLDNILTQLRPEPEYFRVGFYGLSFPLFVRVSSARLSICNVIENILRSYGVMYHFFLYIHSRTSCSFIADWNMSVSGHLRNDCRRSFLARRF